VRRFEASAAFSVPSVYFHQRAIERRRMRATAADLLGDELFLEYVYAVLPSRGCIARAGRRPRWSSSPSSQRHRAALPLIEELWLLDITGLPAEGVPAVGERAWEAIATIRASTSETQIVAGSKTLYHVLPDLIPPIDRQYTFRFFTSQKITASDERAFLVWFPYLAEIGRRCRNPIDEALNRGGLMATSRAKVIDTAIIGFMQAKDAAPGS
jgi:hypothetical protein